jgi:hypothetical protein
MSNSTISSNDRTAALYAVLKNDLPEARVLVGDMLNEELGAFFQQIMTLHEIVVTEMSSRVPTRSKRNGH